MGDLAEFNPKAELPTNFEYVDLESVVGTELINHRTQTKCTAPSRAQRLAQYGDLFYQLVRPYQKNNYLFELNSENFVFSTGYAQLRPSVDGYFLMSLVQNEYFVQKVLDNCTGTSYPAINVNDLAEINIYTSLKKSEQARIGTFFRQLDRLVTLHQCNCNMATRPCEWSSGLRAIAWEQRKLGEVAKLNNGKDYKHLGDGNIPVYGTGGYMLSVNQALSYKDDAIGIGRKGTIDKPYILKAPFWTVDTLFYSIPNDKTELNFLFATFQKVDWKAADESTGVPSLSKSTIENIITFFPSLPEQARIGAFFCHLDRLITLHQRKHILLT